MSAQNLSLNASGINYNKNHVNYRWVVMLLDKVESASPNSIYSDKIQRKLKFNNASLFMVILPAKTKWRGYTKHKAVDGVIKKCAFYDRENQYYEIIDCYGNHYKKVVDSSGQEDLVKIPNVLLKYTVKQEIISKQ